MEARVAGINVKRQDTRWTRPLSETEIRDLRRSDTLRGPGEIRSGQGNLTELQYSQSWRLCRSYNVIIAEND